MDYLNAFDVTIAFCLGAVFAFAVCWLERKIQNDTHKMQYQKLARLCIEQDKEIVQWKTLFAEQTQASTTPQPTAP